MSQTINSIGVDRAGPSISSAEVVSRLAVWAVVLVRPFGWKAWLDDCRAAGIGAYLPVETVKVRRHVGLKTTIVEQPRPLYPGYAFVPLDDMAAELERTRGYAGPAMIGQRRMTVTGEVIRRIRVAEAAVPVQAKATKWEPGDRVRLTCGWFEGLAGTVRPPTRAGYVTVAVDGGMEVHVPAAHLAAID